jgi:hypothetical protein
MGFRKLQKPASLLRSKSLNKVPQTASLPSLIKEEQNEKDVRKFWLAVYVIESCFK